MPIATTFVAHSIQWNAASLIALLTLAKARLAGPGCEYRRLAIRRVGSSGKFGDFNHVYDALKRTGVEQLESFELACLSKHGLSELTEWTATASASSATSDAILAINPCASALVLSDLVSLFKDAMGSPSPKYAYLFQQEMRLAPLYYASGLGFGDIRRERHADYRTNISWWGHTASRDARTFSEGILRDIYPHNYLSESHLSARIGMSHQTLRQWIEANPANRGALSSFTETLTEWAPPVAGIPVIREELYRAGRVFYWRCFCPQSPESRGKRPEPLYRPDLSAPWEAPDPIPEIFRADYWKDKDPGLTY